MVKNGERSRKYSIVIHDVLEEDDPKNILKQWVIVKSPRYYMIALEPYGHQQGHHMHLFIEFIQLLAKFSILKELQQLFKGRIQVDIGRGSRDDCLKYLTDPDKSKDTDTNIINETGVPKIRTHNHDISKKGDRSKCPRCNWLKWWKSLPDKEFAQEARKPYLDQEYWAECINDKYKIKYCDI